MLDSFPAHQKTKGTLFLILKCLPPTFTSSQNNLRFDHRGMSFCTHESLNCANQNTTNMLSLVRGDDALAYELMVNGFRQLQYDTGIAI